MYENAKCEYCGEQFAKNDDIVVCPECGSPYHRKCWEEHGECAHKAEHAQGFVYKAETEVFSAPEEDFVGKIKEQILNGSEQTEEHCENCGAKLIEGDEYCVYCGHKKGEPVFSQKQKHADKDPLGGMNSFDEIAGEKAGDIALVVRNNSAKFMPKLKRLSDRKIKIGWSWPAFIFGYLYLFFRKLYKYGIIVILAQVLLFNVLNVAMGNPVMKISNAVNEVYSEYGEQIRNSTMTESEKEEFLEKSNNALIESGMMNRFTALLCINLLVTNTACALLFNYLYLLHCKETVIRMKKSAEMLGGMSQKDFRFNLLARGGVSLFGVVFGYFIKMFIEQTVAYLMTLF